MARNLFRISLTVAFIAGFCLLLLYTTGFTGNTFTFSTYFQQIPKFPNIFFIESSNSTRLRPRFLCAVESAARSHRNSKIYIYHTSSTFMDFNENIFQNVVRIRLNPDEIFVNTPLERWYKIGTWKSSPYSLYHLSDATRLALVYRHGGIYFDLDWIIFRNFQDFSNFLIFEGSDEIGNSIFGFTRNHEFLYHCLEEFNNTYKPQIYTYNGPQLLTRLVSKHCGIKTVKELKDSRCKQLVNVLEPHVAFPTYFTNVSNYFDANETTDVLRSWFGSHAVHLWNKLSSGNKSATGSEEPLDLAAKYYCPVAYSKSEADGFI